MTRKYVPKYWNHKGKYQKLGNELREKLVPTIGDASTNHGNLLRIASNLYYDVWNNGGYNFDNYHSDRANLINLCPDDVKPYAQKFVAPVPKNHQTSNKYMKLMDLFMDWVICYVNQKEIERTLIEN